jgi:SAM-dependent methyltransferase
MRGMVSFVCNICGQPNSVTVLPHEESSCSGCGSNVRLRALVYLLATELFGDEFLLPEFPVLPAIRGLGLSDQASYACTLARKFDYTNTYYDREPRLDITEPHPERYGTYDFILSSDVFEHIAPPVARAFDEACKLLKPHGVLCLSVPFSLAESTAERFPDLHEFAVVSLGGSPVLINRRKDGALEIRDDLIFHGGVGATLEMRLFSQNDLRGNLIAAGFQEVRFLSEPVPRFGISYEGGWSLPMLARKQEFTFDRRATGQFAREFNSRTRELAEALDSYQEAADRLEQCGRHIDRLDAELAERGAWAAGLERELEEAKRNLSRVQSEFEERTAWALQLKAELETESRSAAALSERLETIAASRWIKLGNRLGWGPKVTVRLVGIRKFRT